MTLQPKIKGKVPRGYTLINTHKTTMRSLSVLTARKRFFKANTTLKISQQNIRSDWTEGEIAGYDRASDKFLVENSSGELSHIDMVTKGVNGGFNNQDSLIISRRYGIIK